MPGIPGQHQGATSPTPQMQYPPALHYVVPPPRLHTCTRMPHGNDPLRLSPLPAVLHPATCPKLLL